MNWIQMHFASFKKQRVLHLTLCVEKELIRATLTLLKIQYVWANFTCFKIGTYLRFLCLYISHNNESSFFLFYITIYAMLHFYIAQNKSNKIRWLYWAHKMHLHREEQFEWVERMHFGLRTNLKREDIFDAGKKRTRCVAAWFSVRRWRPTSRSWQ